MVVSPSDHDADAAYKIYQQSRGPTIVPPSVDKSQITIV